MDAKPDDPAKLHEPVKLKDPATANDPAFASNPDHPPQPESRFRVWAWAVMGSFLDAFCGLVIITGAQANARFHALATFVVVVCGFAFGLTFLEWAVIVLAIALVWSAEAMNTAVESVVDLLSPEADNLAGRAKDAAAGGVLAAAIGAAIVGGCIFGPKIVALFR